MRTPPDLYRTHFIDKQDERLSLFVLLSEHFPVMSALYPGSFTHLTPAFVFPRTCFVDMDRRAARFFEDPSLLAYVQERKLYAPDPLIQFHQVDYSQGIPEEDESFDLLISQYAGFVSLHCKRYLRSGGYLIVNNSHGDASMASIDPAFELVAVAKRRGEKFSLSQDALASYFIPKKDVAVTREFLRRTRRGVAYKKSAFSYLFQKVAA